MRRAGKLVAGSLAAILFASSVSNISCVSAFIDNDVRIGMIKQIEKRETGGYVAGFEGLGAGGQAQGIINVISTENNIAGWSTAGNPSAHMDIIRKAWGEKKKIFILGYSMGENEARNLANLCSREKIEIDGLFLIDGTGTGHISGRVKRAYDIKGTGDFYPFRRIDGYTLSHFEDKNVWIEPHYENVGHLDVPAASSGYISGEIRKILNR
jgi:hypothetical protein